MNDVTTGTKIGHVTLSDDLRGVDDRHGRNYPLDHQDLYRFLGLNPNKHLPKDGLSERKIGNVLVWVVPKIEGKRQDAARTLCGCPTCNKIFTAGKLAQHMKV